MCPTPGRRLTAATVPDESSAKGRERPRGGSWSWWVGTASVDRCGGRGRWRRAPAPTRAWRVAEPRSGVTGACGQHSAGEESRWRRGRRGGARAAARTRTLAGGVRRRAVGRCRLGPGARVRPCFLSRPCSTWPATGTGWRRTRRRPPRARSPPRPSHHRRRPPCRPRVRRPAPTTAPARSRRRFPPRRRRVRRQPGAATRPARHTPRGRGVGHAGDRRERVGIRADGRHAHRIPARRDGLAPGVRARGRPTSATRASPHPDRSAKGTAARLRARSDSTSSSACSPIPACSSRSAP